jgi:SNF2 family DNA or RNA helicase
MFQEIIVFLLHPYACLMQAMGTHMREHTHHLRKTHTCQHTYIHNSNALSTSEPVMLLCCHQVLVRLAAGGHKVLLFCTMTRLLDLLEEYMAWRGWRYLRLDGATSAAERAEAVAQFNRPGSVPMQADAAVDSHTGS